MTSFSRYALYFSSVTAVSLAACAGAQSSAPIVSQFGKAVSPMETTAPDTVAVGCDYRAVAEYKPGEQKPSRTFDYFPYDAIASLTYDLAGNLFIGVWGLRESWVDEYPPGSDKVSRHITKAIHNPMAMATDPDGDLYVANLNPQNKIETKVEMYKPGSTSPAIEVWPRPITDLVFYYHELWLDDYNVNDVRGILVDPSKDKAKTEYTITDDIHGPTALSETGGNLYMINVPFVGADYVREYNIDPNNREHGKPIFARLIHARLHNMKALATDAHEYVFIGESGSGHTDVSVYNRNGEFQFAKTLNSNPQWMAIVASTQRYYVATDTAVQTFQADHDSFSLELPKDCAQAPRKLAIMKAST